MSDLPNALPDYVLRIRSELERRKLRNPCYSMRAYARQLGMDPSALSRVLNGHQALSPRCCASLVKKLALPEGESKAFVESFVEEHRARAASSLMQALRGVSPFNATEASPRASSDYLVEVSHDLRNLLSCLLNVVSFLETEIGARGVVEADSLRKALSTLRSSTERMRYLVVELLGRQKRVLGAADSGHKPEKVHQLVEDAAALMRPMADARGIAIDIRLLPGCEDANLQCHKEEIYRMLSNLLGNAIQFSPSGGKIEVQARCEDGHVTFSVLDSGPGVPEHFRDRIFERRWQADPARSPGIGMGLAIVKDIVKEHQGKLWVESRQGAGSAFFVSLPADGATCIRERTA
jgi:signal transduction histidine kinase